MSGNPSAPASRPIVICGSSRRSLENPLSRNPSPVSVSKYKVDTSYKTKLAGPSRACAAHAALICCRHESCANTRSRRVTVRYGTGSTPASSSTRALSSLLTGSMTRAITSWRNTSSPPVA